MFTKKTAKLRLNILIKLNGVYIKTAEVYAAEFEPFPRPTSADMYSP